MPTCPVFTRAKIKSRFGDFSQFAVTIANPTNFRSAAMVTTFVRSAGDRTRGVWKFLNTVCQTDPGMKLAELEHSSLKKMYSFLFG